MARQIVVNLNKRWLGLLVAPRLGALEERVQIKPEDIEYCIGIQAKQSSGFSTPGRLSKALRASQH
jgi:hypothetical protein